MQYELTQHAAKRMAQRKIEAAWLQLTLDEPDRTELDPVDSTAKHALREIAAKDNRVLRVIYNDSTNPVRIISVYFDRGMRGEI